MTVEYAELADIPQLTELRLAYLKADHGELSEEDERTIRRELPNYFRKNLNQNIFCCMKAAWKSPNAPAWGRISN